MVYVLTKYVVKIFNYLSKNDFKNNTFAYLVGINSYEITKM